MAKIAVYCDVDGTLTDTTIVTPLVWMKRRSGPAPLHWLWLASLAFRAPWWWLLDQRSRAASNRAIYSNYQGVPVKLVKETAAEYYRQFIRPKLFPAAIPFLAELKNRGCSLILVTGGLDVFMEPMAREFRADCIAPALEEGNGVYTGRLLTEPLTGTQKARALKEHAGKNQVDLAHSFALGDAIGDLDMLECVGNPLAVNPDQRLREIARQRGWQIKDWK